VSEDRQLQNHLLHASAKNLTRRFIAFSAEYVVAQLRPKGLTWYSGNEYKFEERVDCLNEHDLPEFQQRHYWDWQAVFWPLQHCVNLIRDEEARRGFKYDHVVKFRPDMALS
jgi:hypothetical protein